MRAQQSFGQEVQVGITVAELKAQVFTVVLNAGRYAETVGCLEALRGVEHPTRLLLVDNVSDALALARLRKQFPSLVTLALSENQGFAAAMNVGMARALELGASHIWLMNNDARPEPSSLSLLLAPFAAQKDCGIVGPLLLEYPGTGRVQSAGVDVNVYTGRIRQRGVGALPEELYPYPFKVDAVSGTAMLIKREVLEQVGSFDPDWFFYYEDLELCLRARGAGFSTWLHPSARVLHRGGGTMGRQPARCYYGVRNQLELVRRFGKTLPPGLPLARVALVAGLNGAQALKEGQGIRQRAANLRAWAQGIRDFSRQRLGEGMPIVLEQEGSGASRVPSTSSEPT